MTINYLDAPAGAGKTYLLQEKVAKLVKSGDSVLFCQPTKLLIDETASAMRSRFPTIEQKVIHGKNEEPVVGSIINHLKDSQKYIGPNVLFITYEAFQRLKFMPSKDSWHLIIDEIPQVYDCFDEQLKVSHGLITKHMELKNLEDSRYSLLQVTNEGRIRAIAENKSEDRALGLFQKLASRLASPHWENYVLSDGYKRLLSSKDESGKLTVFSFLMPGIFHGFESVTIAGACFKDSLLFRSFSQKKVRFVEEAEAKESLRFVKHQNGKALTILYALEKNWSKRLRDKNDGKALAAIAQAVTTEFAELKFVWSANKDVPDSFFGKEHRDDRLPQSPYGLNSFQDVDNVAFLAAHNLIPAHAKFIQQSLGLTPDQIGTAVHRQNAYQAVLRISLRDPANERPKCIFVPDLPTAAWLQSLFEGSTLRFVDVGLDGENPGRRPGRPQRYANGAARTAACRGNKKAGLQAQMEAIKRLFLNEDGSPPPCLPPSCSPDGAFEHSIDSCNENTFKGSSIVTDKSMASSKQQNMRGSLFRNEYENEAFCIIYINAIADFEYLLKDYSKRQLATKEDNYLLSPSFFDPEKCSETSRGKGNHLFSNGIWFDVDGGDLAPAAFANLFPTLHMIIFATFSSTKKMPRYRVYMPTTSIMSYDVYDAITHHILGEIVEAGYPLKEKSAGDNRKAHRIDTGKLNAASLFYLPCQPDDPKGKFFRVFKGKERQPLDPDEWIEKIQFPEPEFREEFTSSAGPIQEARVQNAIQDWRQCGPGEGNPGFWGLSTRLAAAGCTEGNVQEILLEEAHYARSPEERLKDIPRILRQLRGEGKF